MVKLQNRNVRLRGLRTSLRLEPAMWDALEEICRRESCSINEICSLIDEQRHGSTRTAALRAFILYYFRAAATENGHRRAGHGRSDNMIKEIRAILNSSTGNGDGPGGP